MRKLIVIMIILTLLISGCFQIEKTDKKAEGVSSLHVFLKDDKLNFNITLAKENLQKKGYSPVLMEDMIKENRSYAFNWSILVKWNITDKNYKENYSFVEFTVFIVIREKNNITTNESYISVHIEPIVRSDNPSKKQKDKELTKQAVYEIAEIIGVELDWERHSYTISWMDMTSEGTYEEK